MEWWSFELLVLLAGLLPNPKLETAVLSICLRTITFAVMVPTGLGAPIRSVVVQTTYRANKNQHQRLYPSIMFLLLRVSVHHACFERARRTAPAAARVATQVAILLAVAVCASGGLVMVLARNLLAYAYSNDDEVAKYTARVVPVLAASILINGLQSVLSGVVRGCGRQKLGAFINLVAYYIVGIPAVLFFAFVCHLGGMGLGFGLLCGLVAQMILLLYISLCTNWEKRRISLRFNAIGLVVFKYFFLELLVGFPGIEGDG